ncbi:MAG: hypothetical protein WB780_02135 [Candidatus Acidiferrales bacterium]
MLKVLLFLFFLVIYGFLGLAAVKSLKKLQSDLLVGKSFWGAELLTLIGLAAFFGYIYLLSGLWSLKLVLLILIASQLGSLVAWVPNAVLGQRSENAWLRTAWAGKEITPKYPKVVMTLNVLATALAFLYLIVVGVAFFRHQWGSPVLQVLVVKYSLLLLIFSNYFTVTTMNSMMLASANLDEDSRQNIFFNRLGEMIPTAVYLALACSAFGFGEKALSHSYLGVPGTLSLQAFWLLLLFFVAMFLIPYLVGTLRARRANLSFLEKIRDYVAELADILEAPTGTLYITRLTGLANKVISTRDKFTNDDVVLTLVKNIEKNPDQIPLEHKPMVDVFEKTRDLDARYKFLDELDKFEKELSEIVANLQERTEATIEPAARHWSKRYESRKADLVKEIEATGSRKPLVTVVVGTLVTTIGSGILSEVAKLAWQLIPHAPK